MSSRTDSIGSNGHAVLLRGSEKMKRGAALKWTAILDWTVDFILCHAKKRTITIKLVTTKAVGTSQRAVRRICAVNLRRSLR